MAGAIRGPAVGQLGLEHGCGAGACPEWDEKGVEQWPAGWHVSGQRDGTFVGAQTVGAAAAETWWRVAEETQMETGGLVGAAMLRAGRVFEDGDGVVSHEVRPAASSSEGRRLGVEGFVQSL